MIERFCNWFVLKFRPRQEPLKSKQVFVLSTYEWNKVKILISYEKIHLCLNQNYVQNSNIYEIIYKNDNIYSLMRFDNLFECQKVFDDSKKVLNDLTSIMSKKHLIILEKMSLVLIKNPHWSSAHVAAYLELDKLFIHKNTVIVESINCQSEPDKLTPLHLAIQCENLHVINAILALNPDLTLKDAKLNSIYHYGALVKTEVFYELLKLKKAREMLRWVNISGCTPAHLACYARKYDNIRELLKFGVSIGMMTLSKPVQQSDQQQSNKKKDQDEMIIQFSKDLLEDLDTLDMKFGGTPLHWVKTRASLEKLIELGFKLDVVNINGETVLHVMTRRRKLKCIIGLLCYGANVDDRTNTGNTSLFYAIEKPDVSATQALIAFDADYNIKNNNNDTVRHIAATSHQPDHDLVLYVLSAIGAPRCQADHLNCTDGCAYNGHYEGLPYDKWPKYDNENLYNKVLLENIIQDATKGRPNDDKKRVRLLCFDGGGVKGILTVQMLYELSKQLKKPLMDYFDWIAGTSTGSIIALMLCTGKTPKEMLSLYFRFKDKILIGSRPYSSSNLEKLLKDEFGKDLTMRDLKDKFNKNVIITATLIDRSPAQLHLFRSYPSTIYGLSQVSEKLTPLPSNETQLAWEACRASGAAPTYFRAHKNYLDGGLIANNPTLDALAEFRIYNSSLIATGRGHETEEVDFVLSFGTGRLPLIPTQIIDIGHFFSINLRQSYKGAMYIKEIGQLLINQITNTESYVVDRSMALCSWIKVPCFRLNPPLSEHIAMDETKDIELINAIWEAKTYMYAMRDQIRLITQILDFENDTSNNIINEINLNKNNNSNNKKDEKPIERLNQNELS